MLLPLYLFSIWIEKRILDTLQENQVLPDNCPILHPEETQESVILKERFFLAVSLKRVSTMNTAGEKNCLDL